MPRGAGTLVGRVGLERRIVQIRDAVEDPQYQWRQAQELGGFRTMLGVPMLADGRVVGVIALWRAQVDPFDERTIELVTTFAAQGALAIQNVQLFQDLEQRSRQLGSSVDELRALGEVSQAVSSSLDLDEVLTTILTRAAELSGADGGSIFEFEPSTSEFVLRTCMGTSEDLVDSLHQIRIGLEETFIGQAAAVGEVRQAPDLDAQAADPHVEALRRHGWRSMVAVPLRRADEIIGALIVRRKVPGALPPETVGLLETLASQSVVAIHNARVFHELEQKTSELEVAGQHKSDFLASMSHELRTPLNAVIGFSDVLLDRMFGELNERQDEYVRDIRDSGRHLLELINEILDLSKVEAGRMELDLDAVSLPDLIVHGVTMVRERASGHGIALACDVDPDARHGLRRRDQAQAGDPQPAHQRREVHARRRVRERDGARDRRRGPRERPRHGHRDRPGGAGSDLRGVPARRPLRAHGHRGDGPRPDALAADRRPPRRAALDGERARRGQHVLLRDPAHPHVDPGRRRGRRAGARATSSSSRTTRRSADLLRVYLEDAQYQVSIARDGVEGLELARRLQPAAVILDMLLPRLNGWDLLAELKGDPGTSEIPVLIVSMVDEQGAGFALGAADYLVKPVDRASLLGALSRCVSAPGDQRTLVAIDDDPVDLDLLEAVLAPQGWRVVRATGGEDGIRAVLRERPAVVVLDLLMPDLDGFAVVEQLRADPLAGDIPVVVLTSKTMTRAEQERLDGQISFLAQKGTLPHAELVSLVARAAGSPSLEAGT